MAYLDISLLHPHFLTKKFLHNQCGLTSSICRPPKHKCWLILSGSVDHTNGTSTYVDLYEDDNDSICGRIGFIDTSLATGNFPLPVNINADATAIRVEMEFARVVTPNSYIRVVSGTATDELDLKVVEFDHV